jgi:hypothetical protein
VSNDNRLEGETCDYCTEEAEYIERDGGDLLCARHRRENCSEPRLDTSVLTRGTLRRYGK